MKTGESLRSERVVRVHNQESWLDTHLVPLPDEQGEVNAVLGISRDITARKEREKSQRESEERLQKTSRMARVGGWEIDSVGNTLSWTEETFRIYELETDHVPDVAEAIGFYHPEDQSNVASAVQSAIDNGGSFDIEARLITAKKNLRWVRATGNAVLHNGHSVGMGGMIQDITEQRQEKENLREINELFSLFMQYSPIYTYIKEVTPSESRILQASDNFEQMIGISGRDMIGKTMEELFPAEFAARITADDQAVIENGEVLKLREDLDDRRYHTIKFPVAMRGKTYLAGYTIDITDRIRNEQALQKLTEELRMHQTELETQNEELKNVTRDLEESRNTFIELYDFASVGYFTLTDTAIIAEVTLTGASMLGIVRQDLIQNRFRKFIMPSDRDQWDRFFLNVLQQGKKLTCMIHILRSDETVFFARIEGVPITLRDGSRQVRFVMSDVSEEKCAEEMLNENETKVGKM